MPVGRRRQYEDGGVFATFHGGRFVHDSCFSCNKGRGCGWREEEEEQACNRQVGGFQGSPGDVIVESPAKTRTITELLEKAAAGGEAAVEGSCTKVAP
ncbi:unnamed protein product [Ectocarpus sp. CCAP 1310/34]|nr:unnamed protein product [Ectocarpus sp. CCAP 1310/34]